MAKECSDVIVCQDVKAIGVNVRRLRFCVIQDVTKALGVTINESRSNIFSMIKESEILNK